MINTNIDRNVIINPGVRIGLCQHYTVTWHYDTIFLVHDEESNKINILSNHLEEKTLENIKEFMNFYLTNQN